MGRLGINAVVAMRFVRGKGGASARRAYVFSQPSGAGRDWETARLWCPRVKGGCVTLSSSSGANSGATVPCPLAWMVGKLWTTRTGQQGPSELEKRARVRVKTPAGGRYGVSKVGRKLMVVGGW